jgi:hypothetical protein
MTLNKKVIYTAIAVAAVAIIVVILSQKQKTMNYTSGMEHSSDMNHSINSADHTITSNSNSVLSEAGTDPFAVIQEAIALLEANSDTDWSAVNIEALRSHLVEMQDMTLNVTVEQQPINLGFMAVITPTTNRAVQSMIRVLSAHPSQMKIETGWDMTVTNNNGIFTITVTTDQLLDVDKIRGLGYIGIMAYGKHHQPHHWAMASGENPHSEQAM